MGQEKLKAELRGTFRELKYLKSPAKSVNGIRRTLVEWCCYSTQSFLPLALPLPPLPPSDGAVVDSCWAVSTVRKGHRMSSRV